VLSWVHVLEWRAAVTPDAVALTDDRGGELSYAGLAAAMEREAAGYAAAETVHAVVVAGPGLDTAGLIDWAYQRLAGFKCPTGVSVVAQLPRNATGKVLRSALREPFWAGRDRRVS
jgi:acyl-CoA synthetase (AMP-forming)/AMP-acid ligase II